VVKFLKSRWWNSTFFPSHPGAYPEICFRGGQTGGLGTEVPQRVQSRDGSLGAKPPEAEDIYANRCNNVLTKIPRKCKNPWFFSIGIYGEGTYVPLVPLPYAPVPSLSIPPFPSFPFPPFPFLYTLLFQQEAQLLLGDRATRKHAKDS